MSKYSFTALAAVFMLLLFVLTGCTGETTTTPAPALTPEQELIEKMKQAEAKYNLGEFPDMVENRILTAFIDRSTPDDRYAVVYPETGLDPFSFDPEDMEERKDYIKQHLSETGNNVSSLVDKLFELNGGGKPIGIKSSVDRGYFINIDEKYDTYLVEVSGGAYGGNSIWDPWVRENTPHFGGFLSASVPAYDPETGYVLIYSGFTYAPLAGSGGIHLMKYEDETLTEIYYLMLWIS